MSSLSTAQESTPDSAIAPAAPSAQLTEIVYPSADGKRIAETYLHFNALITVLKALEWYLRGQQATVLANQFLYYSQGYPRLRVAPDVMLIFNVAPGGRDNYKIWEEGEIPSVIFEVTSPGTRQEDQHHKHWLYQQMGVDQQ
ncbi:Uma2 family endonuclease [Limnothrix sp. FACHB-708]|nr:Uma2 family endonuclease [Limnothrix sp. FACHB-708]MBD2591782.1 Uma2 family endonuclease [Limnothrix sp. FACHB-406]